MIKRVFYRQERGEKDDASDSESSSSSDSDLEAQTSDGSEAAESEDDDNGDHDKPPPLKSHAPSTSTSSSSSSGYESENSSAEELDPVDSSGLLIGDDSSGIEIVGRKLVGTQLPREENNQIAKTDTKNVPLPEDLAKCILKHKSVFKCRLCPKIVCLNEDSLRNHLNSKRHSRSEKLLNDGRLKRMLNSDGEEIVLEEVGETHAERYTRILALTQEKPKKKNKGRQRQRQRLKRKQGIKSSIMDDAGQGTESHTKKRRKNM
ncbi:hypothetical protein Dimus_023183 [Dionaea muscipula]